MYRIYKTLYTDTSQNTKAARYVHAAFDRLNLAEDSFQSLLTLKNLTRLLDFAGTNSYAPINYASNDSCKSALVG
jgi:hypothetical protein